MSDNKVFVKREVRAASLPSTSLGVAWDTWGQCGVLLQNAEAWTESEDLLCGSGRCPSACFSLPWGGGIPDVVVWAVLGPLVFKYLAAWSPKIERLQRP